MIAPRYGVIACSKCATFQVADRTRTTHLCRSCRKSIRVANRRIYGEASTPQAIQKVLERFTWNRAIEEAERQAEADGSDPADRILGWSR